MTVEHKLINYGSKVLELDVNLQTHSASIRFGTRRPRWLFRRKLHETTISFQKADAILRHIAKTNGVIVQLRFDTADDRLKKWSRANSKIFGFDQVEPGSEDSYRVTVYKDYRPQ